MRTAGAPPFSARDERELVVIADHASVAVKKSRLFEAAQAANHAKSTFLATISHELRTPLTALTGYGELLSDEVLGSLTSAQHDAVARMQMVTHHLSVMIEEILLFSSIEAGRERLHITDVDPSNVVRAAMAVIEPLARKKPAVQLVTDVDPGMGIFASDQDKVRQILVNLIGNALKFTDAGQVTVSATGDAEQVRLVVADTGIGISPEDLAGLFQPFTQVDATLTRRHGGTGLGLYISNRLTGILSGRIEVESAPGLGSTFTVVLPRLDWTNYGK